MSEVGKEKDDGKREEGDGQQQQGKAPSAVDSSAGAGAGTGADGGAGAGADAATAAATAATLHEPKHRIIRTPQSPAPKRATRASTGAPIALTAKGSLYKANKDTGE